MIRGKADASMSAFISVLLIGCLTYLVDSCLSLPRTLCLLLIYVAIYSSTVFVKINPKIGRGPLNEVAVSRGYYNIIIV